MVLNTSVWGLGQAAGEGGRVGMGADWGRVLESKAPRIKKPDVKGGDKCPKEESLAIHPFYFTGSLS